jgi:hypothetical protein
MSSRKSAGTHAQGRAAAGPRGGVAEDSWMKFSLFLCSVSVALLSACAGGAAIRQVQTPMETLSLEALQASFAGCVSPFGVGGNAPLLAQAAADEFTGGSVGLSDPGIVSDGYYHLLVVNREGTLGIIVQTGGFANHTTMYGPYVLSQGCGARASSANGAAPAGAQGRR